jgi:hypothetical protein
MLEALAKRNGQITMPTLRQGWNGQTIGGSYSTKDKKVIVQSNTYRLVVVMGVQPEYAEFVLKDHAGGTPQRFVWFQGALDSKAPTIAPEWPGELLTWEPRTREHVLSVSEAIRAKVDVDRLRSLNTGGREVGQYDGQRNLLQLKLAALLSLLEPEQSVVLKGVDIDDDDWQLAGTILQVSDNVRAVAQTRILDHKDAQYAESDARAGIRARTTLRATDDVKRVARTIARVVNIRCGYGDSLPYRDLHNAVSSRDRKVRNLLRDAISHACAERLITEIEGENDERRYEPCDGWNPDL